MKFLFITFQLFVLFFSLGLLSAKGQDANAQDSDIIKISRPLKPSDNETVVNGVISDAATHKPLRGIRITYQDFSAAISDSAGTFSIRVPNYNVAIVLEGEGYQRKEIALKGSKTVSAVLYEEAYTSFYDGANMPFGNLPQNQVPYSVSSFQTKSNWARTDETPDALLQGKVAGLMAIRRSGTPNIGANLFLRGISSLYTSNQPLVVIDGVIFDIKDYGNSIISNNYTNPLAYVDVKDIENITVLKDGSSTYGTKGGNGVIIITTTRARELATRIDFAVYGGINFTPEKIPVMNADDYRTFLSDVLQSGGIPESQVRASRYMNDDPSNPDYYRYHQENDWQDKVFKKSFLKNYYMKITGGDNIAKYALSLGYLSNSGIIRETKMDRYNTRFNADLNLSRRLLVTTNLSFTFNEQNLKDQGIAPKTNPIYVALIKSPFIGVNEVSDKGIESPSLTDTDTFNVSNPVALIDNMIGLSKNYRFFGSVGFNYSLTKPISLSTIIGVTVDKVRENFFIPRKGVVNDTLPDGTVADSRLGSQTKRILALYNDTRISYDQSFNRIHHLSAHAGIRFQQSHMEQDFGFGANSATDDLTSVGTGVSTLRRTGGDLGKVRWLNTYLNADYALSDKYFLSFNVAFDGSSRFGKKVSSASLNIDGTSFAVLPSIAAAWLISSEKIMATKSFIDLLKLRASFGFSGNDDIGNFTSLQTYSSQNFLGMQGLVRNNFGNDWLQWESMQKINAGIDAALLKERFNLTFDFYKNETRKMIIYEPTPTFSGLSYAVTNSGGMKTTGLELSVTGRIISKPSLKWDVGFTVAHYKSILASLPDEIVTEYAGATIVSWNGKAPNLFYGYQTAGVYESDQEAFSDGLSVRKADGVTTLPFKGGDIRFMDNNGDKIIDVNDREVIGDPNPDFFGSFNTSFQYKNFSLEALFTFMQGNDVYNYTRRQLESLSTTNNQTTAVINRWRADGQITDIPRASLGDPLGNSRFSDRWIEDGSYLRLRTATISYNIPLKTEFLRYSIIYLTGNNLFTLTKYLGYDPEMSSTTSVLGQGVDITLEPQHRSIQLGIRLGL
ncbi:MAG TPA: SusC/RagA family TonB-linked outer membrane protein [Chitinophagaceae bacterium]|jgi:TonB-linked SusC/RagA family outer membrane protein|nr:SusC/RagA family TonB-linked outer membrane protein [Chitinophagaceae bacterium]